jgi:hypothetical protein
MTTLQRRRFWPHLPRTLVPALAITALLGVASPVGAATTSSAALRIAQYAVATATHDNPSHVVTAADVSNAAGIPTVNTTGLVLLINLGDVFGYSRLVLFYDTTTYADTCLSFPDTVSGTPKVFACPRQARALWDTHGGALAISNRAVAAAAATGHAVSGADVVAATKAYQGTLRHKPTFLAGQGGKVEFTTKVVFAPDTKFTVNNCVQLPKTAYGIPVLVPC